MANEKRRLTQDRLVEQLRPEPAEPALEAIELKGYLGKSEKPGYWRVYDTPELDSYYEIQEADIVSHEPAADSGMTAGRVLVRKTTVQLVRTVNLEKRMEPVQPGFSGADYSRQASFLKGEYSTLLDKVSSERGPTGAVAASGILCDFVHTWGGGYTCPVYKRGEKLHDSLDVSPCAYTLGFDPGCDKKKDPGHQELITERAFCTWSCSWHEWCKR